MNTDEDAQSGKNYVCGPLRQRGFARAALAAFLVQLDPTVPQLADMKTAVSEAVTNCIVHAYPDKIGPITMTAAIYEAALCVLPSRTARRHPGYCEGDGADVHHRRRRGARGSGLCVMQSFMDKVKVSSTPGRGTRVTLTKRLDARA